MLDNQSGYEFAKCTRASRIDPVSGEILFRHCASEREYLTLGGCGPDGLRFEPAADPPASIAPSCSNGCLSPRGSPSSSTSRGHYETRPHLVDAETETGREGQRRLAGGHRGNRGAGANGNRGGAMNVLELAQEAGLAVGYENHLATTDELQRFADLVLEEAAKACEELDGYIDDDGGGQDPSQRDCVDAIRALKGAK
jgi:hypothetical protein